METIDTTEYYLDIYEKSNIGPQNLKEDEEYDVEEKKTVLENIRTQADMATEILIQTALKLDIGAASTLSLPPSIIIP